MKIKLEHGYISVVSRRITYWSGLTSGTPELVRAAAFFPFIFFRSEEEKMPWVINHERIHFRQQLETLFVGFLLLEIGEILYVRFVLRKNTKDAYLWYSWEQEAYRNQQDQEYLKHRKIWSLFKYMKDKKIFTFGKPGEIIFTTEQNTQ